MYDSLASARNTYAYPAVGLTGTTHPQSVADWAAHYTKQQFHDTLALDEHHTRLLNSKDSADMLHGLFSTVYWGYYTYNNVGPKRCAWMAQGKRNNPENSLLAKGTDLAVSAIKGARDALRQGRYGAALKEICHIPYVGVSFGSKVLAFIDPENVGVLDMKIVKHLGLDTYGGSLAPSTLELLQRKGADHARFHDFCLALNEIKLEMNSRGLGWKDQSGAALSKFRAVDVERALFALAVNAPR